MKFDWKDFKIDLFKFNEFLINNVPEIDGISANPNNFELIEVAELSEEKQQLIQNYYDSLSE